MFIIFFLLKAGRVVQYFDGQFDQRAQCGHFSRLADESCSEAIYICLHSDAKNSLFPLKQERNRK